MTYSIRWTAILILLPTFSGCEIVRDQSLTCRTWLPAGQSRAFKPSIGGVIQNCPARGDNAIVVNYRALGDDRDVAFLVPIDAAGDPVSPFKVEESIHIARATDFDPVVRCLGGRQLDALTACRKYVVNRTVLATHLNGADWHPIPGHSTRVFDWFEGPDQTTGAYLFAYTLDDRGGVVEQGITLEPGKSKEAVVLRPLNTHLMLVPISLDRPVGDRTRSRDFAIAMIPLTIPADAVQAVVIGGLTILVTPFFIFMGMTNHWQYH